MIRPTNNNQRTQRNETDIYILRDADELGPYSPEVARQLLSDGALSPNDIVKIGRLGKPFPAGALISEPD